MSEMIYDLHNNIDKIFGALSSWLWGWLLIALLMGTHIYMTLRLGFVQRHIGKMIRLTVSRDKGAEGDISHWGALATALAATVGTGNIVGVATAISLGGPGAVFWMWMTGVLGMATKYAEAVLSIKYRTVNAHGQFVGGPMYALERGMNCKWLAVIFASFAAVAAFGIGNMNQASAISDNLHQSYGWPKEMIALLLMVLAGSVIIGGVKSIARVCQFLVPVMVLFYLAACAAALIIFAERIPGAILTILSEAIRIDAAGGAVVGIGIGQAMRYGIARGLFSNESGMGSAPIVAAAAKTTHPVRQGLVSASGTFWDTVVICLMTGLVIVSSGQWLTRNELGERLNGTALTSAAFGVLGDWSPAFLSFTLFTFVFSTILGWAYIGEKSAEYLFGSRVNMTYRFLWVAAVGVGSLISLHTVFNISDTLNALMVVPNVICVLCLARIVADETSAYLRKNNN
jgi:AGCS family alanine or glycine:cation symporter